MARIAPFEAHTQRYEDWFARHDAAYRSELAVLRELMTEPALGLEVGVGTGRFAAPLGVEFGLDPSPRMLRHARRRGIRVVCGVAEALPFRNAAFGRVLIVTTLCFVDDALAMCREAARVLGPGGSIIIGFIDRTSGLGRQYQAHKEENVFYRDATFFSAREVARLLFDTGFGEPVWRQTLVRPLEETTSIEASSPGFGTGAFVAVRAVKASTCP